MGSNLGNVTFWPPGSDVLASVSHKIKIHNSIIWIWGRKHAILREKLHRVLGSRSWNHGLNGELCPEHFQKDPRIFFLFGGSLCGRSVGRCRNSIFLH